MSELKSKFCNVPFRNMEVTNSGDVFTCCYVSPEGKKYPSQFKLGNLYESSPEEVWNSEAALKLRRSILDGSFKYCSKEFCPRFGNPDKMLADRNDPQSYNSSLFYGINQDEARAIELKEPLSNTLPTHLCLNTSLVCNYMCPTCTVGVEQYDPKYNHLAGIREKKSAQLLKEMTPLVRGAKFLFFGGKGEPLSSSAIKRWLGDLSFEDVQNLHYIEIQTNGSNFTPEFWNSLPIYIQEKITAVQISVDAATKETYEKKNRIGGRWQRLWDNLRFIRSTPQIKDIVLNFVIQDNNFREMAPFVEMAREIGATVRFSRVGQWPLMTDERFKAINIFDREHPNHQEFLKTLESPIFKSPDVELINLKEFVKNEVITV